MFRKQIENIILGVVLFFAGCNTTEPAPIKLNVDNCEHCKMTIADLKFASELITDKGRIYKFDDIECMLSYNKEKKLTNARYFIADYNNPVNFVSAEKAFLVSGENIQSPMNGNKVAFSKKEDAEKFAAEKAAVIVSWGQVNE